MISACCSLYLYAIFFSICSIKCIFFLNYKKNRQLGAIPGIGCMWTCVLMHIDSLTCQCTLDTVSSSSVCWHMCTSMHKKIALAVFISRHRALYGHTVYCNILCFNLDGGGEEPAGLNWFRLAPLCQLLSTWALSCWSSLFFSLKGNSTR